MGVARVQGAKVQGAAEWRVLSAESRTRRCSAFCTQHPAFLCALRPTLYKPGQPRKPKGSFLIRPERLTVKAGEAVQAALGAAATSGNPVVNDSHLFQALLDQSEGIVVPVLQKTGLNATDLRAETERELARLPTQTGGGSPTVARELNAALDRADSFAQELGDAYVSTEHLLMGLVDTKGTTARQILEARGIRTDQLIDALGQAAA